MNGNFLRELVSPENPAIDIVAVHGLNVWGTEDHGNRCWTAGADEENGVNWLRDFLPARLPQARVLTFHYNANVIYNVATTGVGEHASNLLNALWLKREPGGLVVKEDLVKASNTDSKYASILIFTYGIAFVGTPHQGSTVASWTLIITRVLRFLRQQPNNDLEDSVDAWGLHNEFLRENFEPLLQMYHFLGVYETLPQRYAGPNPIVAMESAVLGLQDSQETVLGLNRDHTGLCKFRTADDGELGQVLGNLSTMARDAITSSEYTSVYDETIEAFQRLHVHVPGRDQVLSMTEAVRLGTRIHDSVSEYRHYFDQIDQELVRIRSENYGVVITIVFLVTTMATALAASATVASVFIPRFAMWALSKILELFLSQLEPQLETVHRNALQNLEWSQFSVQVLAEKQSTVLRSIQHLRTAQENATHPVSPELLERSSELQTLLEDVAVSIGTELHQRATQAASAKRQFIAARQAQAARERAAEASSTPSRIYEAFKALLYTVL